MAVSLRASPIALVAFAFSFASGLGFFCSSPLDYWPNPAFRWKMLLIVLAGINALSFAIMDRRSRATHTVSCALPLKISAGLSLTFWVAVIVLGRLLPYTGTSQ